MVGAASSAQPVCRTISSRFLAMASEPKRQTGRDDNISKLNQAIDALNLAKGASGIAPTQAAFGAASGLLTTIRVRRLRYHCDWFFTYVSSGLQRRGVCGDRTELRRYLSSARSGTGREETGRPQSVRLRSDQPVNNVSLTQRRTI